MWRRGTYLGCSWKLPFVCICNYVHINKLVRCIYCTINPITNLLSSAKLTSELGHLAKKSSFQGLGQLSKWILSQMAQIRIW